MGYNWEHVKIDGVIVMPTVFVYTGMLAAVGLVLLLLTRGYGRPFGLALLVGSAALSLLSVWGRITSMQAGIIDAVVALLSLLVIAGVALTAEKWGIRLLNTGRSPLNSN